jgi:hypothetical protein
MMQRYVIFMSADQKVLGTVVRFIPVDVVDDFRVGISSAEVAQWSPQCLLGDKFVLVLTFETPDANNHIAVRAERFLAVTGI